MTIIPNRWDRRGLPGFIFLRFRPGPQGHVAGCLHPHDRDFRDFRAAAVLPAAKPGFWAATPVNWKSVCDVDNEGYHVALTHPTLQEPYGRSSTDIFHDNGPFQANATYGDRPGRCWSVRNHVKHSPLQDWLPPRLQRARPALPAILAAGLTAKLRPRISSCRSGPMNRCARRPSTPSTCPTLNTACACTTTNCAAFCRWPGLTARRQNRTSRRSITKCLAITRPCDSFDQTAPIGARQEERPMMLSR